MTGEKPAGPDLLGAMTGTKAEAVKAAPAPAKPVEKPVDAAAKAPAQHNARPQTDLFDQKGATGPGERQTDVEDLIAERKRSATEYVLTGANFRKGSRNDLSEGAASQQIADPSLSLKAKEQRPSARSPSTEPPEWLKHIA